MPNMLFCAAIMPNIPPILELLEALAGGATPTVLIIEAILLFPEVLIEAVCWSLISMPLMTLERAAVRPTLTADACIFAW